AWKTGAYGGVTGAQAAELRAAPNGAQPPSTLPMAAERAVADLPGQAGIRTDLNAPPVMVGAPKEEANASARPGHAMQTKQPLTPAFSAQGGDPRPADGKDPPPPLSLTDPRGPTPAAAAAPA